MGSGQTGLVYEFLDVSPRDLSGLHLHKEINGDWIGVRDGIRSRALY